MDVDVNLASKKKKTPKKKVASKGEEAAAIELSKEQSTKRVVKTKKKVITKPASRIKSKQTTKTEPAKSRSKQAQKIALELGTDLLVLVTDSGSELAHFQSQKAHYLDTLSPNQLLERTAQDIVKMKAKAIVAPMMVGDSRMFNVIIAIKTGEKRIYVSYLSPVATLPKIQAVEKIMKKNQSRSTGVSR